MPKRYIVTGKDEKLIYLRTDFLKRAVEEAAKHSYIQIWKFETQKVGHLIIRVYENGKLIEWR